MLKEISIIMASFNTASFIRKSIDSVLDQTFKNWELLIIDDCSEDDSLEVIGEYLKKKNINLYEQKKNKGPAICRNFGIEKANGRFIAFLDSDDYWEPEFLEKSISFMKKNNVSFTFSSYNRVNEQGKKIDSFIVPNKINYEKLLKSCPILCSSVIFDTKDLGKQYMPLIKKRQDYGLFLLISKKINFLHGINRPMVNYRIRQNSVSRNKFKAASYQWKIYRDIEKFNILKSLFFFVHYSINGILKYYKIFFRCARNKL